MSDLSPANHPLALVWRVPRRSGSNDNRVTVQLGLPDVTGKALPIYDALPPGCIVIRVDDNDTQPVLRVGDCVVVDMTDTELVEGELYAMPRSRGARRAGHEIVQMITRPFRGDPALGALAWWYGPYHRPRTEAEARELGHRGGFIACDGPYIERGEAYLREKIAGRVVGIFDPSPAAARPMLKRIAAAPFHA